MTYDADVIIVGSGPAGAAAALELSSRTKPVVLDVGDVASTSSWTADRFAETLGADLEGLSHIGESYLSPKLRSPLFRYVTRNWRQLSPINSSTFRGELSLALGGLANAWGSGLYEFDDRDLRGFPIKYADLEPFYRKLTRHIGICGGDEQLGDLLGPADDLLPPMPLSGTLKALYARAKRARAEQLLRRSHVRIGKQRLGILTQPHRDRAGYAFDGKDFFQPWKESVYNPGYTIRELVRAEKLDYRPGYLVKDFKETSDGVKVRATELETGNSVEVSGKTLLLGAGAINSARIVLQSYPDSRARLPLLENPVSFIPFVDLSALGSALDRRSFSGAQLILLFEGPEHTDRVQGSLYNLAGVLASDFFLDFPLTAKGNLFCLSNVLGAMSVLQLFYSDAPDPGNFVTINADGEFVVQCHQRKFGKVERKLIKVLRKLGLWSLPVLVRWGEAGGSFHYAGTLGMTQTDSNEGVTTDSFGRLHRARRVYAIDASTFPVLPAKNLSLTIMANAMRIAAQIPE